MIDWLLVSSPRYTCTIISLCRQFRSELGQWEENGDPLTAWVDYLNWLEARGLSKHTSYKTAIQKCINYFKGAPEYHSEIRLARIYLSAVSKLSYLSNNNFVIFFVLFFFCRHNCAQSQWPSTSTWVPGRLALDTPPIMLPTQQLLLERGTKRKH